MRKLLALFIGTTVLLGATAAYAGPSVGYSPEQPWPGSTITVSGSGWQPGSEVVVQFLGFEEIVFVDDNGDFSSQLEIPLDTPLSEPNDGEPLDVSITAEGGGGAFFQSFDVPIVAPPPPTTTTTTTEATTTTTAATTTTTQAATTTAATTTTEATTTTTQAATTTAATTTTTQAATTTVPSESEAGNGFPWLPALLILLVVIVLGTGLKVFWPWDPDPAFIDDQGNEWVYCAARACKTQQGRGRDENDKREVRIRAVQGDKCTDADCMCVLFIQGSPMIYVNEDQDWVPKKAGKKYVARCVKRA